MTIILLLLESAVKTVLLIACVYIRGCFLLASAICATRAPAFSPKSLLVHLDQARLRETGRARETTIVGLELCLRQPGSTREAEDIFGIRATLPATLLLGDSKGLKRIDHSTKVS